MRTAPAPSGTRRPCSRACGSRRAPRPRTRAGRCCRTPARAGGARRRATCCAGDTHTRTLPGLSGQVCASCNLVLAVAAAGVVNRQPHLPPRGCRAPYSCGCGWHLVRDARGSGGWVEVATDSCVWRGVASAGGDDAERGVSPLKKAARVRLFGGPSPGPVNFLRVEKRVLFGGAAPRVFSKPTLVPRPRAQRRLDDRR